MKVKFMLPVAITLFTTTGTHAQSTAVPVTVDNFARAESDLYMGKNVKEVGLGKFQHVRTPTEIDKQMVIRMTRDTLYS